MMKERLGIQSFGSIDEAWVVAAQALHSDGVQTEGRNGGSLELLSQHFRLLDPEQSWLFSPIRKAGFSYAAAELLWYLRGSDDGEIITAYSEKYAGFLNEGKAFGAYGKRWKDFNLVPTTVRMLKGHRNSRQVVMACWHPGDLVEAERGEKRDLPCTLSLQFLARDGKLNLIVTMRSNDWWLGMPYDVWCFCQVQRIVAACTGLKLGWYEHHVGSLHCYDSNKAGLLRAVSEITAVQAEPRELTLDQITSVTALQTDVDIAAYEEERIRKGHGAPKPRPEVIKLLGGPNSLLSQLVILCAKKFDK